MDQKHKDLLDHQQQLRTYSCFQMAPELALKFAGILKPGAYPFQNHDAWDKRGYEPYNRPIIVDKYEVTYTTQTFLKSSYEVLG